jgi:hypothetical protein
MLFFENIKKIHLEKDIVNCIYNNVYVWPILRYHLLSTILFYEQKSDAFVERKFIFINEIKIFLYSILRYPFKKKNTQILVMTSPDSLIFDNELNKYTNRVFDKYLMNLNSNIIYLEDIRNVNLFDHKIYRKNRYSIYLIRVLIEICTILKFNLQFQISELRYTINPLIKKLVILFNVIDDDVVLKMNTSSIKSIIRSLYWHKFYKYYLMSSNVKTIFIEDGHYGLEKAILCNVAYNLNIQTIEIQHGFVLKNHIAYNIHEHFNYPVDYFKYYPIKFFTFGKFWSSQINTFSKIIEIGVIQPSKGIFEEKKLLIVSNGADFFEINQFINKVISDNRLQEYRIFIRPHPHEVNLIYKRYNKFLSKRVFIDLDSLESSLSNSEIVISVLSTVLFQSLFFCKKVYLLNTSFTSLYFNDDVKYFKIIEPSNYDEIFDKGYSLDVNCIEYYWSNFNTIKFEKYLNNI